MTTCERCGEDYDVGLFVEDVFFCEECYDEIHNTIII